MYELITLFFVVLLFIRNFDSKKIEKLRKLSEKLNCFIKIENGKILLEDDQGVENVIKILCDYYKEGRFSGKTYGTYAGKIQKV